MKQRSIYLFILIILSIPSFAQQDDIVQTAGIKSNLHQNNIGKIFFTSQSINSETLKQEEFLQTYILTNKSDLFFIAYFNNSLTNYKHQLSPGITADSLFKIGDYQFTFFVDGKEIYRSNLLPGAPYARIQDTATMLNRPLVDNINGQGSWSESCWNRFLRNGGDSALTDGNHILQMEIRPYVKKDIIITGNIIAAGSLQIKVAKHPIIDLSKIRLNKIQPYNGFALSKEKFDINRIKELKGRIEEGMFKKINGIVVIKNGKLLIEEYFNGENRQSLHDPRSVGKSFASTLMGMAIADKYIKDENEKLSRFYHLKDFTNYNASKENATVKDMLTMSAGFEGNDENDHSPGNEENMYPTADWVRFGLDLSYNDSLRKHWHYFTAGVIVLGDIINKSVPKGLEQYADAKLFKPLGITNYQWQYTPQHVPNTAGGIQMNALDFAKYGQLYKNGGVWNSKTILPKAWVTKTITRQVKISGRNNEYYSYLFWNKTFTANAKPYEAFYCAGNGGNYILVFKDQPLVIVITASAYGQPYAHPQVATMLTDYILPAVIQ